jgi:hypothetical protein
LVGFIVLFGVVPLLGYIGSLIFQAVSGSPPPKL